MEDPSKYFRILIKFMDEQFVDSFVNDGLLYMNNIDFFRNYESEENGVPVRGDKHEGLAICMNANDLVVTLNNEVVGGLIGKVDLRYNHEDETNIYSMTRISDQDVLSEGNSGYYLSPEFEKFGNKAVLILGDNIAKFQERLDTAIKEDLNIFSKEEGNLVAKQIDYLDRNSIHGNMGVFRKFKEYSWQREWRIAFKQSKLKGAYSLKLGSIADLVTIADTKKLIKNPIELVPQKNL